MAKQSVKPGLHYSAEHEWLDADHPAHEGVTAVATDALGEVVYVDLPQPGSVVHAGEVCGELESTKAVSDLYSPVTGHVVDVNDAVVEDPSLVNADPYGRGWLFSVEVDVEGSAAGTALLTAEAYAERFDAVVEPA